MKWVLSLGLFVCRRSILTTSRNSGRPCQVWKSLQLLGKGVLGHWPQSLSGAVTALLALIAETESWTLPPRVWIGASIGLFLWAIAKTFDDVRQSRDTAESALREQRDCLAIADRLTERYQAGMSILQRVPELSFAFLGQWGTDHSDWQDSISSILHETNCSLQEINHFETVETSMWLRENDDIQKNYERLLRIQLQRLADLSTSYADRAEQIRVRAATR